MRAAPLRGLGLEASGITNPYRSGVSGSSDTHTAAMSVDEDNFFAKIGLLDSTAILRGSVPIPEAMRSGFVSTRDGTYRDADGREFATGAVETWGAAGLAAVWAERNTRDAIYAAFRRKETFATSGPRLRVRLFAGYDYGDSLLDSHDMAEQAYAGGVTMGSDIHADGERAPRFLAWATRDPDSAALQRLQVVKGYLDENGQPQEQVYDVACSDGLEVNPDSHRCPDNGAVVNTADCSITAGVGAAELKALWSDPDFEPAQRAFYYVRALENPTCRWSTWDAVRAGVEPRDDLHTTIQERAWSSPIWYLPASSRK